MLYITDNYSSCTSRVRGNNLFTSFWLASKKETLTMHPNNLLPTLPNIFFPATINWKSVFKQKLENLTQIFFDNVPNLTWRRFGRTIFLRCILFQNFSKNDPQIPCFFSWDPRIHDFQDPFVHEKRGQVLDIHSHLSDNVQWAKRTWRVSVVGGGVVPECPKWGKLVELDGHFWIHLVCLSWKKEIIELKGRSCPLSTPTWPSKLQGHSRWHSLVNFTGIRQDLQTCSAFFAWEKVNSKAGWFINPFEKYWRVKLHHSPKNQGEHFPNHLSCHHLSNGVSWNPI